MHDGTRASQGKLGREVSHAGAEQTGAITAGSTRHRPMILHGEERGVSGVGRGRTRGEGGGGGKTRTFCDASPCEVEHAHCGRLEDRRYERPVHFRRCSLPRRVSMSLSAHNHNTRNGARVLYR